MRNQLNLILASELNVSCSLQCLHDYVITLDQPDLLTCFKDFLAKFFFSCVMAPVSDQHTPSWRITDVEDSASESLFVAIFVVLV